MNIIAVQNRIQVLWLCSKWCLNKFGVCLDTSVFFHSLLLLFFKSYFSLKVLKLLLPISNLWTSHSPPKNQLGFGVLFILLRAQMTPWLEKPFCEQDVSSIPGRAVLQKQLLSTGGVWEKLGRLLAARAGAPIQLHRAWGGERARVIPSAGRGMLGIALLGKNRLSSSEGNVPAAGAEVTFNLGWWLLLGSALQKGCRRCQTWGTLLPWVPGGANHCIPWMSPHSWGSKCFGVRRRITESSH